MTKNSVALMDSNLQSSARGVTVAYVGCWYKNDMYSHNCRNLVEALRARGLKIDVITSNCRCFSSALRFDIATDELINTNCATIQLPHAPHDPGWEKHGMLKYMLVKVFRLDIWLAVARGFLYYWKARKAKVIQYDQVLEAFGSIPLFILAALVTRKCHRLIVTVHEIDHVQRAHKWINRMYRHCSEILVYSDHTRHSVMELGVDPAKIRVIRYGVRLPDLSCQSRTRYIYFGGHFILRGKGYPELIGALAILKSRGTQIKLVSYVGHGCNGLAQAREMAVRAGVSSMIEWGEFFSGEELARAYQTCKACIVPYTGGSARHPLSSAMANATPVIATRAADISEYLGELGIYIDGSSEAIANAICDIESGRLEIRELGHRLRERAASELEVGKIAERICDLYAAGPAKGESIS